MRERRRAARQPRATSHFFYPFFVPSVATLSQQIRRHSANRPERSGIITRCSTNTKCTPADDYELSRTLIQGLDADVDCTREATDFFWRDLGPRRAVAAVTLIVGAIFGCLFWPAFAVGTIWRAVTAGQGAMSPWREMSDVFTYILALSGVWTILVPAVIAAKFRRLNVTASVLLLFPVYYLLVSVATWVAMLDLALRPHYWAKTAHGRSRQRQTPVIRRTQLST